MDREQARARTEQKLRYAQIHLDELRNYSGPDNDEWACAHEEDFLYHVVGAVEALLHEVNAGYPLNLDLNEVKWKKVQKALEKKGLVSPAFTRLEGLREDESSWLSLAFELRHHGTHRERPGKNVLVSAGKRRALPVENEFKDPRTGTRQTVYPNLRGLSFLSQLSDDATKLVDECRSGDPHL